MEFEKINQIVGRNIREWRKCKELKQEYVAYKLRISKSALSQIENGHTNFSLLRLSQIADIMDVSLSDLLNTPKKMQIIEISSDKI